MRVPQCHEFEVFVTCQSSAIAYACIGVALQPLADKVIAPLCFPVKLHTIGEQTQKALAEVAPLRLPQLPARLPPQQAQPLARQQRPALPGPVVIPTLRVRPACRMDG